MTNRLKNVIDQVVHRDQSYSVPGRSIFDNINLIRDSLLFCNSNNLPLALLNLDQKKAFDNVDHKYLFNTLKAMGFGQRFVSYVQVMYLNTQSLIKVGGSLTPPFSFEKGIRQGCPLSGLLYSIAIEPLLHTLCIKLNDISLKSPCGSGNSIVVSAYADDVTIFLTNDSGFDIVRDIYSYLDPINPSISSGIMRVWFSLEFTLATLIISFRKTGKTCRQKLDKCLSRWKRLSFKMSLKGRVLIANQIVASKLFHTLATLSPPEHVIGEFQGKLIDFIWNNGKH